MTCLESENKQLKEDTGVLSDIIRECPFIKRNPGMGHSVLGYHSKLVKFYGVWLKYLKIL